jgi:lipopolysaccharide export LptBFGC system permease protein LptF
MIFLKICFKMHLVISWFSIFVFQTQLVPTATRRHPGLLRRALSQDARASSVPGARGHRGGGRGGRHRLGRRVHVKKEKCLQKQFTKKTSIK